MRVLPQNRKEVLGGKRALSVPLVLEMVGCTKQVALQILFSGITGSNYGVPLCFAAVNIRDGVTEQPSAPEADERWEHIKMQITAVSYIQKDALQ